MVGYKAVMVRKLAIITGWMAVIAIVFSTLSPIGLRPRTGHPDAERFLAFFLAGACLAIGYPRCRRWVSLGIVVGGALLEAGQFLVAGRDAHVHDAAVKVVGGVVGITLAAIADHLATRQRPI